MCGYGRHSIALAKKGIQVTAIDNLEEYIVEMNEVAINEGLPLKAVKANVINYNIDEFFDLAICMGNSLNFFDAGDIAKLFASVAENLKPGGHLLINSWSIAEISFRNFKEKSWSTVDDMKLLTDARIYFHPARIETESTIITKNGIAEVKTAVDYIYSINELEKMLFDAGMKLQEVYSIPGRKKFSIGEPRAYLVAEKMP
jgi:SAM-dependent methyltransferase